MINSVSSGSYISEIIKFDAAASLKDRRDSTGRRFRSFSCRLGTGYGVDVAEISPFGEMLSQTDHTDVARIKTGNDLSCASSRCARTGTDISPDSVNFSPMLKLSFHPS